MCVALPDPGNELRDSIRTSILNFDFRDYSLDEVEDTKSSSETMEWLYDLARDIEENWCNYVDGL